jgi:hypothetical protein
LAFYRAARRLGFQIMSRRSFVNAFAVAGLCMFAGACSTMTGTLFPDKPSAPAPATALPQAGTSFFSPVPVTPGTPSGSLQGQRVADMRNRLVAIQGEVSARNANLSEIRQRAAGEGALYRIAKSELTVNAAPTPQTLQQAQTSLERFATATFALDGEMRVFAKGAAEANRLMTESTAVRDGSEDDMGQLNTLRAEIGQTANQLDRLVNEISNEWAMQSAFLAKERASLTALGAASSASTVTTASLTQALPATTAMLAAPAFVTIKFDRANVSYRDALAQAVSAAKRRNPATSFDVIGVAAGRGLSPDATARAQEVATTLTTLGVEPAKIRLFNAASPALQSPEVRIYAR